MKILPKLTRALFAGFISLSLWAQAVEPVEYNFEQGGYDAWTVEGEAFGERPQTDEDLKECKHRGIYLNWVRRSFSGEVVASSLQTAFTKHEPSSLTSPAFTVTERYLNLKIGGESRNFLEWKSSEGSGVQILVNGEVVLDMPYTHRIPFLRWYTLDLKDYVGMSAQLRIFDNKVEAFILVDDVRLENVRRAAPDSALSREIAVTGPIINLPLMANNNGAQPYPTMRVLKVQVDGETIQEIVLPLAATGEPDLYAPLYVDDFIGRKITLEVDQLDDGSTVMQELSCAEDLKHDGDLYEEELRPRVHFSPARGYANDPNGLVYYDGEYHLFWQHDPFNMGNYNFYWGHAVSTDLVHWKELRPALRGGLEAVGFAWSGGAFVDWNNDGGWQNGDEKTIVATFWDYHIRKSSLAYSTDRGRHFTRFEGSPIVDSQGSDPSRVFYYEPTQEWCLVVTDKLDGKPGMRLFHSKDLKTWTKGNIAFFNEHRFYECPDFYELPICDRAGKPLEPRQTRWIMHDGRHYYAVCTFDGKTITVEEEPGVLVEPGSFYAAQSFSDIPAEDGRKIVMAWQRRLEVPQPWYQRATIIPKKVQPFNGQLTFPVEMTLRQTEDGLRLFANPVREIANLHRDQPHQYQDVSLTPENSFKSPGTPKSMHAVLELEVGTSGVITFALNGLSFTYDCSQQELTVLGKTQQLKAYHGVIKLEVLLDITAVDMFFNEGEIYIPANHIGRPELRGVEIKIKDGEATLQKADLFELNSMWK